MTLNKRKGIFSGILPYREEYIRKILILGIPIVFQNLISLGLNLLDTLMIGRLGEAPLAAVGAANQVYFVLTVSIFGLLSGSAVYTSQFFGAKEYKKIKYMLGMNFIMSFTISFSVGLISYLIGDKVIGLYSSDSNVISLGYDYMKIACISYPISALSFSISYNSRAIQRLKAVTTINFTALCINGILNYILIFGKLGFEPLGVKGAAIATLMARISELLMLILYIRFTPGHIFRSSLKELFGFNRNIFKAVLKTSLPVVFTEGSWSLAVALIFAAYGMLGTAALAVSQVANVLTELVQSFFFGVGNSTAMIIGESLGQNDKEKAYGFSKLSIISICILNVVATAVLSIFSKPISDFYNFSGDTKSLLISTIITMAFMITPKMLGYIFIVGILRAGGDTLYCMYIEIFCNVFVMLPMAYFAVAFLHVSLPVAIVMVELGDLIRILFCIPRFLSKKWIRVLVD